MDPVRLARLQRVVQSKTAQRHLHHLKTGSRKSDQDWFDLLDKMDVEMLAHPQRSLEEVGDRELFRDYKDLVEEIGLFPTRHGAPEELPPHERRRLEREYATLLSSLEDIRQELSRRGLLSRVEKGSRSRVRRFPGAGRRA